MDLHPQIKYIKSQVEYEIKLYTGRKQFNRRAAFLFTLVPASLAALATICIGTSESTGYTWLPIVAMVCTGIASVLGAWESLFANKKLWRVNNVALTGLYLLKSEIEYREHRPGSPIGQDEIDAYFEKLKEIRAEGERSYQQAVGDRT